MKYEIADIKNIAKFLAGFGNVLLPESIILNEVALYEICYDLNKDTSVLDENEYSLELITCFFKKLADEDYFVSFVDYYFNRYIENRVDLLTTSGYSVFQLKDKILTTINSLWSIGNQEFGLDNSKIVLKEVTYKEYDKMGKGGFCTVYRCQTDKTRVYKVLNLAEKNDVSSVHRFKREYEIMREHNDSGYTLNVFDYDEKALVYSIEKASISLEDYIQKNVLSDKEKDEIIIRCAECMKYLHNHGVIHRDFHPGNILKGNSGKWLITDFGLAKDISRRYSHQTTTTHAVGRAWFTDPVQLFALKNGNYQTDMFSLAKTIDYIMNGNMSGEPHKYSSVIYKATASNPENRYSCIEEMCEDLGTICARTNYESPQEIVQKMLQLFKQHGQFDVVQLIALLNKDVEGDLMWNLILALREGMCEPFLKIIDISFDVALREICKVYQIMCEKYQNWIDYDWAAYWAIGVINRRKNKNDEINIQAARIIEYVATNVTRWDIQRASNKMKNDSSIDGHVRAELTYHEGF